MKRPKRILYSATVIAISLCALAGRTGTAQLTRSKVGDATNDARNSELKNSPSYWRATPTDLSKLHDDVPESFRKARDFYWDSSIGGLYPLTGPEQILALPAALHYKQDIPAVQNVPGAIWVLASFESARSRLSASQRSIYTEVRLRVDWISCGSLASVGDGIDVAYDGGSVILHGTDRLDYRLRRRDFDIQPGHRYLLQLALIPDGRFYREVNSWEIVDGILKANSYTAAHGRPVAGLPKSGDSESEATKLLRASCDQKAGTQFHLLGPPVHDMNPPLFT